MSTHNIQFCDKMRKFPLIFVFLSCRKDFKNEFKLPKVNEPSVFELSRFDCTFCHTIIDNK